MDIDGKSLHTVTLDPDKCKGCVTCMKRCPTEAIRVRNGKAKVLYEKCIGCGECVRLCPHHAKKASFDPFDTINAYKYRIALPAPSLYGQFNNLNDINYVLNGLLAIGFHDVFEVGRGAELVSSATKILLDKGHIRKPVISTACPAVLELIMVRYKHLLPHLLNLLAPVDIAAKLAREKALSQGVPAEDIGVFFISPCPAKVYALKSGLGVKQPIVEGVLGVSDVYLRLLSAMSSLKPEQIKPLSKLGVEGMQWAASGGEAAALYKDKYLAADGVENVNNVLKALEDNNLRDVDFIELNACVGGCVGGVLNVENPFIAKARLRALRKKLPNGKLNTLADQGKSLDYYMWEKEPEFKDVYKLDEDRHAAFNKLIEIDRLLEGLPQIDCGECGAPSCRAFCEDLVTGELPPGTKCPKVKDENIKDSGNA